MSTSKHIVQDREILFATITSVRLALTFVVIVVTLFITLIIIIIIESEQFTFPHFENLEVGAAIPVCLKSSNCTDDNTFCPQESDDNEYYYTRLKTNNLRVLLISNPSLDWSSASMSVGVGSIDNPEKIDGLAHLCEHAIVLQTKKYPSLELSKYLKPRGGELTAYTRYYETTFQFVSPPKDMELTLDVFSQSFISPLFDEKRIKKELCIIEEEFHMRKFDESTRSLAVLRSISRKDSPFYRFRVGNFKSLNKDGLLDELIQFYQEKYSAEAMNLVVYSKDNISTILQWVTKFFSDIPTNNNYQHQNRYNVPPFLNRTGKIIIQKCEKHNTDLLIRWQTPGLLQYKHNAVAHFIYRYLNHEGGGSILKHLKERSLATKLTHTGLMTEHTFGIFGIKIELSQQGMKHVSYVIKIVFEFLDKFQTISEDLFNDLWTDFIEVHQSLYEQVENTIFIQSIEKLSLTMSKYEHPADFLSNPKRYYSNFSLVQHTLQYFTPDNSLIILRTRNVSISSNLKTQVNFDDLREEIPTQNTLEFPIPILDHVEPIFNIPFTVYQIPHNLKKYWTSIDGMRELYMALPNPYIPNLNQHHLLQFSNKSIPSSHMYNSVVTIWTLPTCTGYYCPVNIRCYFQTKTSFKSPYHITLTRLYRDLVKKTLTNDIFSATEVYYDVSISLYSNGMEFYIYGFNDYSVIYELTTRLTSAFKNEGDVLNNKALFYLVTEQTKSGYMDFGVSTPIKKYIYEYIVRILLERPFWPNSKLLQELYKINLSTLLEFGRTTFMNDLNIHCLFYGGIQKYEVNEHVLNIVNIMTGRLGSRSYDMVDGFNSIVRLQAGKVYGLSLPNLNIAETKSALSITYEAGEIHNFGNFSNSGIHSLVTGVHLTLLHYIMKEACFHQLRTVQGLGYSVDCFMSTKANIGYFNLYVLSERHSPDKLQDSVNILLFEHFYQEIKSESFKTTFSAKMHYIENIISEGIFIDEVWANILSKSAHFNLYESQLIVLKLVTLNSFQKFYYRLILDKKLRRKLVVVVYAQGKETVLNVDCNIKLDKIPPTLDLASACE